jgi:uncharacterized protein involved in exopolysaccharide biosynthesis
VTQARERMERDDPVTVREIWGVLRNAKWALIVTALVSLTLAVIYAIYAPSWFRVEVLLKPADTKNGEGMASQSDAAGALASLTGINISSGNSVAEPMAILQSREFTGAFIQDKDLMPVLYARRWDAAAHTWKPPQLFGLLGTPDIRDGEEYFRKRIVDVQENKKTGLVTLSLEWKDPKAAADWANELVDRVNERMRQHALAEAEYNVNYLEQQLAQTNLVPLQQSIGRVLESELQKLMLAKGNKEYSFRVIDHAQPPRQRVGLTRPLIVLEGLFLGLSLCMLVVILRHVLTRTPVPPRVT